MREPNGEFRALGLLLLLAATAYFSSELTFWGSLKSRIQRLSAPKMHVAVVGASGRLGQHIVRKLRRNKDCCTLSLSREHLNRYLAAEGSFRRVDALVIALGSGHFRSETSQQIDGDLAQQVIKHARDAGVGHVILLSSVGVDDFRPWSQDMLEEKGVAATIADSFEGIRPEFLHWKRETEITLRATAVLNHTIVRLVHNIHVCDNHIAVPFPAGIFAASTNAALSLDGLVRFVAKCALSGKPANQTVEVAEFQLVPTAAIFDPDL
eukprot:TRINITY_DN65883_c0_g1_i1.p1 TRINITY_DN65883_c0_g1~~TRINITY_DN65883_c0_g1_i1.p1  ORF type:complete len:266 (-),score=42.08 TRINITY_DN65883_c0_g1_i1:225-1022(-)